MRKHNLAWMGLAILLTGCSTNNMFTPADSDNDGPVETTGFIKEKTEIRFLSLITDDNSTPFRTIVEGFEKLEPNVKVTPIYLNGYGDYASLERYTMVGFAKNDYPDLVQGYTDNILKYIEKDKALRLDDYINNEAYGLGEERQDYIKSYIDMGNSYYKPGYYSMPFCASTELMYYNADKVLGLDLSDVDPSVNGGQPLTPEYLDNLTWPQFWSLARAIKAKDNALGEDEKLLNPYTVSGQLTDDRPVMSYSSSGNLFITLSDNYGDGTTTGYTTIENGKGKVLFNNDTMKSLMSDFNDYYHEGLITTKKLSTSFKSLFTNQNSLFTVTSNASGRSNFVDSDGDGKGDFRVGVCHIPHAEGKKQEAINQGPSLVILDHKDANRSLASWLFYKYLTNAENSLNWSLATGYMGIRHSNYTAATYREAATTQGKDKASLAYLEAEQRQKLAEVSSELFFTYTFDGSAMCRTQAGTIIEKSMTADPETKTETIQALFDNAQRAIDALINA